jgi:hypothetical protein
MASMRAAALLTLLVPLLACGEATPSRARPGAGPLGDAAAVDAAPGPDAGAGDASLALDAEPADAAAPDGGAVDAGLADAGGGGACVPPLLPALPSDRGARGPFVVGARTASVARLRVEVWYPAAPGSEQGATRVRYDLRDFLPASERSKISDVDNPWQDGDAWRDLPIDDRYGPYPAVIFVHGTAGFRSQSLEQAIHWASRGFVVIAADHPGLWMADLLGSLCGQGRVPQDLGGDVRALAAALAAPSGGLAFLAGRVDAGRLGLVGHSAGGSAVSGLGELGAVIIPMAAGGTMAGPALRSTLVMGATRDGVVPYSRQVDGYVASPAPKRLVGIADTGHLAFSSLCALENAAGEDILTVARRTGVCGALFAGFLFDCEPDFIDDAVAWSIVNAASAAALEEVLHCADTSATWAGLEAAFPQVSELREE